MLREGSSLGRKKGIQDTENMETDNILTIEASKNGLIKKLVDSGLNLREVTPINQGRYFILCFKEKSVLLAFKRDTFHNFGIQFKELGYSGVGDTLNKEDIGIALDHGVSEIFTIFPRGIIYKISMKDFLKKSLEWTNKEGKEVLSISIHEYNPAFDLGLN